MVKYSRSEPTDIGPVIDSLQEGAREFLVTVQDSGPGRHLLEAEKALAHTLRIQEASVRSLAKLYETGARGRWFPTGGPHAEEDRAAASDALDAAAEKLAEAAALVDEAVNRESNYTRLPQ